MESVEETELDLTITNRDADENLRKELDLGEKPREQRKDTIQSNTGDKQKDNTSLWKNKGNESITMRNVSENTQCANIERNAASLWKTSTVTPGKIG
eukprot:1972530-Ditylum_brightwellii.AAC.1